MNRNPLDIDRLLDAVDLVSVVERAGGKLKKSAKSWRGACPIHGGDNATAFSIFTEKGRQLWKCHTAQSSGGHRHYTGGTAIQFVIEHDGLDFMGAVKSLAQMVGLSLEQLGLTPEAVAEHEQREKRSNVLELAAKFYEQYALSHPVAHAYAERRGFTHETIECAGFGYSNGNSIAKWLKEQNADLDLAREIGLLRADGFDFTANANGGAASRDGWLVYVHRAYGQVEYLSARAVTPAEAMPDPKDKSRNLPGARRIYRAEVPGDNGVVIVEGQADAESLRQVGRSAWAMCGAQFTERELSELKRCTAVYVWPDADMKPEALTELCLTLGPMVYVVLPPREGKDANELLAKGVLTEKTVGLFFHDARPFIQNFLERAALAPEHEKSELVKATIALIARTPENVRGKWLKDAADKFKIPVGELRSQLAKHLQQEGELARAELKNGRMLHDGLTLGNWNSRITHQLELNDGHNAAQIRYTIESRMANNARLPTVEVLADDFESGKWLSRLGAKVMLDVGPKDRWRVMRAIQEISLPEMKEETVYQFSGWTKLNGQPAFLSASGAITAEGHKPDVRVDLESNLRHYRLPAPIADVREAVRESLRFLDLAPDSVTVPLWLAMYAAPLTIFRSLDAMLWVYGQTQSRKSTLALLALTHFGQGWVNGTKFKAPMDWLSTFASLEGALFQTKDLPLVIDDYTPQATEDARRRLLKTAQDVIRTVGNRSTRGRANGDLSLRAPRPPRGLAIATSEKELEVQSTVGRMVYVPIQRGDVKTSEKADSPLDIAQQTNGEGGAGLYAHSMSGYIRFIAQNWESVESVMNTAYEDYNRTARKLFTSTQGRMLDIYALFMSAGEIAINYAADTDSIPNRRADELKARMQSGLVTVLQKHSKHVSAQSPARRLFEALQVLLAQGKAYLAPRTADEVGKEFYAPDRAVKLGYIETAEPVIFLMVDPAIQAAKEFYARTGESFDTLSHAFNGECRTAGLLKRTDEDRATVKVWTRDGNQRLLVLDADKLYSEYDVWLWRKDKEPKQESGK